MKINERVPFRLLIMGCCGHQLCWVNPRLPSYCPECGKTVYPAVKSWITFEDNAAFLCYHTEAESMAFVPAEAFAPRKESR